MHFDSGSRFYRLSAVRVRTLSMASPGPGPGSCPEFIHFVSGFCWSGLYPFFSSGPDFIKSAPDFIHFESGSGSEFYQAWPGPRPDFINARE